MLEVPPLAVKTLEKLTNVKDTVLNYLHMKAISSWHVISTYPTWFSFKLRLNTTEKKFPLYTHTIYNFTIVNNNIHSTKLDVRTISLSEQ